MPTRALLYGGHLDDVPHLVTMFALGDFTSRTTTHRIVYSKWCSWEIREWARRVSCTDSVTIASDPLSMQPSASISLSKTSVCQIESSLSNCGTLQDRNGMSNLLQFMINQSESFSWTSFRLWIFPMSNSFLKVRDEIFTNKQFSITWRYFLSVSIDLFSVTASNKTETNVKQFATDFGVSQSSISERRTEWCWSMT